MTEPIVTTRMSSVGAQHSRQKLASATQEFATVLSEVMLSEMLPKSKAYGHGAAGEFARSQLGGVIARHISQSDAFGVVREITSKRARAETGSK